MSNEAKTLIERVRALPPEDRIALVEEVLDSLDRANPDIDQLWTREATDRVAAYRRGELATKDLSDVVAAKKSRQSTQVAAHASGTTGNPH